MKTSYFSSLLLLKATGFLYLISNTDISTSDYRVTDINGISRLAAFKTPNGLLRENNLQRNFNGAYIIIDYSSQAPSNISRARLEEYTQTLITDANAANIIEFVEILYKNDAGQARLLLQVRNGIITILN